MSEFRTCPMCNKRFLPSQEMLDAEREILEQLRAVNKDLPKNIAMDAEARLTCKACSAKALAAREGGDEQSRKGSTGPDGMSPEHLLGVLGDTHGALAAALAWFEAKKGDSSDDIQQRQIDIGDETYKKVNACLGDLETRVTVTNRQTRSALINLLEDILDKLYDIEWPIDRPEV